MVNICKHHQVFMKLGLILSLLAMFIFLSNCNKKNEEPTKATADKISAQAIGLAYLEENQFDEAERAFKFLIGIDPADPTGYANLGLVYLRMGKYRDAQKQTEIALKMSPKDTDIRLIYAKIFENSGNDERAIAELNKIVAIDPKNSKSYYNLAELYSKSTQKESLIIREQMLQKVVKIIPANIVPRLNLIEVSLQNEKQTEALKQLEYIKSIVPVFPQEAENYYKQAVTHLLNNDTKEALTAIRIFHNLMKATPQYQSGNKEIKGPGGELIGFPVITYGETFDYFTSKGNSIMHLMRFTDVTTSTGLELPDLIHGDTVQSSLLEISDYDIDGDIDVYYSCKPSKSATSKNYLFNNEMGSFTDLKKTAGFNHKGIEKAAAFADYDNDGNEDLFISMSESYFFYHNNGDKTFTEVGRKMNVAGSTDANGVLFFDYDQEGDLDLFLYKNGQNKAYRNNGDGSFTEQSESMGLSENDLKTLNAGFGDFDDDGDVDLFCVNENGSNVLFTNQRQGKFKDITETSNLKSTGNANAAAVGDYNNDGLLDIFTTATAGGSYELNRNRGDGTFEKDQRSSDAFKVLEGTVGYDAGFFDFDNDGYLDLLVAGKSQSENGRGVFLFHNDSLGKFMDVSHLLPNTLTSAYQVKIADFNEDGDLDMFFAGPNGVRLIRNENGNVNHYIKVQLVGLSNGNSKNNHFGIGSKLELRAGNLYQVKVVTEPVMHFGLGGRSDADVLRIVWTNGVPQNIITPKSNQHLLEESELKGSCPFLYTWNGERYVFVKDMMWRSALGMPLGIMGGKTAYAFPDISTEYLKIPGEMLKPKEGKYSIKVTEELWEAVYIDQLRLLAIDHPASEDVFVDEKFVLPPFPGKRLYKVSEKHYPVSVRDENGRELLPFVLTDDNEYIHHFTLGRYQGITEIKDIIIDLGRKANTDSLFLFLTGWIFPTDASINVAISQAEQYKPVPPSLQVINAKGEWQTVINSIGFPMGKNKTVIVDLTGKFLTNDRRIKISTNMQIYWNHIFFSPCDPTAQVVMSDIKLLNAGLQFRGYSAGFRKGIYGPHWFDYYNVSKGQKWRDLTGYYTRYGDVLPLLLKGDDKYIIANAGDEVSLEFDAKGLPELPHGWQRDFLIYSEGWVKDGDLNTTTGQTVLPLPFRAMSSYPYGDNESYPAGKEYEDYRKEYNTRKVDTEKFRFSVREDL